MTKLNQTIHTETLYLETACDVIKVCVMLLNDGM